MHVTTIARGKCVKTGITLLLRPSVLRLALPYTAYTIPVRTRVDHRRMLLSTNAYRENEKKRKRAMRDLSLFTRMHQCPTIDIDREARCRHNISRIPREFSSFVLRLPGTRAKEGGRRKLAAKSRMQNKTCVVVLRDIKTGHPVCNFPVP